MSNNLRQFKRQGIKTQEQPDLLLRGLEVLTIKEGDTVVIRSEVNPMTEAVVKSIQASVLAFLKSRGTNQIHFLVIPPQTEISVLSENTMKQAGWERAGRIIKPV